MNIINIEYNMNTKYNVIGKKLQLMSLKTL